MPCDNKAFLKGIQVAVCSVALVFKIFTTWEAERVNHLLQKQSREWTGASYTHAVSLTSIFMDITFGGFFLICLAHLIGHIMGDVKSKSESLLMVLGFVMMAGAGGILVTSVDDVPDQLIDNTIILAVLSLVAGVLFLADAGTKCARKDRPPKKPANSKVKREITVIPKKEETKEEDPATEPVTAPTTEQQTKADIDGGPSKSENGGISSVQIRIKDPKKNWAVYGDMPPRSTSELDVLAEAEAVDRMLSNGEHVAMSRSALGHVPNFKQSPLRHTSSFYITPTPHFAWKRLSERT